MLAVITHPVCSSAFRIKNYWRAFIVSFSLFLRIASFKG